MDVFRQVVEFNNQGVVTAQQQGNDVQWHDQIQFYQGALRGILGLLDEPSVCLSLQRFEASVSSISTESTSAISDSRACCRIYSDRLSSWTRPLQSNDNHFVEGVFLGEQVVFARTLNLVPSMTAYSDDPFINVTIATSIVLFNLAVTYHQHCLKHQEDGQICNRAMLLKTISLYKKAQDTLNDLALPRIGSGGKAVTELVTMAIQNNLGQVCNALGDYDGAGVYYSRLIHFASSVNPEQYDDEETAVLLDLHKSYFLTNAFAFAPPTTASAA